ncbi:hypothetical protein ACIPSA_42090 [Streptomyces sp. NPDC086549]|uniref:hypothetical protein n=1 Tax=Streptomyces sp. NPDC086549 TaxID=3365752 RepID=UPI0038218C1A
MRGPERTRLLVTMARTLLPSPDPVWRRRACAAARRLVNWDPGPADDVTTGADVAKLARLHLLYLQSRTRKEVSYRKRETAVRLARSSIATCLLGMCALHEPDAVEQLKGRQLKSMRPCSATWSTTIWFPRISSTRPRRRWARRHTPPM